MVDTYKLDRHFDLLCLQKWGWTGLTAGAWAELEVDTRADASGSGKGGTSSASVWLTYLRSYTASGNGRCAAGLRSQAVGSIDERSGHRAA